MASFAKRANETPGQAPEPTDPANETQEQETGEPMAADSTEGESADGGEQPNVTPEEQADYEAMSAMALDMVYGKDYLPHVMKAMSASKDGLAESIGMLGANIMKAAVGAFKEKGKDPDPEMVLQVASNEVIPSLVELAVQAGRAKEADAPALIRDALFAGTEQYGNKEIAESGGSPEGAQEATDPNAPPMQGGAAMPMDAQPQGNVRPNRAQRRAMKFGANSIGGRA